MERTLDFGAVEVFADGCTDPVYINGFYHWMLTAAVPVSLKGATEPRVEVRLILTPECLTAMRLALAIVQPIRLNG